jgi:hypothetical protein
MGRRVLMVVFGVMLVTAACGGASDTEPNPQTDQTVQQEIPLQLGAISLFTCNQLAGATPASAVPTIESALTDAATAGFTGPELRDALRAKCPDSMVSLESDAEFSSLFEG